MQVKNFGRRGRTKHTHLVDVDTTNREDLPIPGAGSPKIPCALKFCNGCLEEDKKE